jgi:hypothetical protein
MGKGTHSDGYVWPVMLVSSHNRSRLREGYSPVVDRLLDVTVNSPNVKISIRIKKWRGRHEHDNPCRFPPTPLKGIELRTYQSIPMPRMLGDTSPYTSQTAWTGLSV